MIPLIDREKTGQVIHMLMRRYGYSVKDLRDYLSLGSVQSIYHWLDGRTLPTLDNIYALSCLFQVSVDEMICGEKDKLNYASKAVHIMMDHQDADIFTKVKSRRPLDAVYLHADRDSKVITNIDQNESITENCRIHLFSYWPGMKHPVHGKSVHKVA